MAVQLRSRRAHIISHSSRYAFRLPRVPKQAKKTLLTSAADGNVDEVKRYLEHTNINTTDHTGKAAIHVASFGSHTEVVELLLDQPGLYINLVDKHGKTALHLAALSGAVEVVKTLSKGGIDITVKDKSGRTALHDAIDGPAPNRYRVVTSLLANPKAKTIINDKDGYECTALSWAFKWGDKDTARALIVSGADTMTARLERAVTPLPRIILEQSPDLAMLIVKTWIYNNRIAESKRGHHKATLVNSTTTIQQIAHWVPDELMRGWFDLTCQAALDGIITWDEQEKHGPRQSLSDVADTSELDNTTTDWESAFPREWFRLLLLPSNAQLLNDTALHVAGRKGNTRFFQIFVECVFNHGNSLDQAFMEAMTMQGAHGRSPLQHLVDGKHWETLRAILNPTFFAFNTEIRPMEIVLARPLYNAIAEMLNDPELEYLTPTTNPLEWAAAGGLLDLIKLIVERDMGDIVVLSRALYQAASRGHTEIVDILLARGADPNIKVKGPEYCYLPWTPLAAATEKGHLATVRRLLCHDKINLHSTTLLAEDTLLWWSDNWDRGVAYTPLGIAIRYSRMEVAEVFISHEAVDSRRLDLSLGSFEDGQLHQSPLGMALRSGQWDIASRLLDRLIDLAGRLPNGETILEKELKHLNGYESSKGRSSSIITGRESLIRRLTEAHDELVNR
ncbi:ankyrin repeat-containing domain protein [Cercophora samala]|uniref:Ankyrin repeat-containing domain protein n=1 Tax=Cercophora samala TaxID=330535 RepID=A0AA39ZHH2_9PEZI|nr:ankyrin repeat-containing domain protein [Cercophora samala]